MPAETPGNPVQIGEWRVDPRLDTLTRNGESQKIEPRSMRLLMCLIRAAPDVVSVEDLLSEVWAGVVVGPASVYQAVSQLRRVLHDTESESKYIATVPRKGYRLVAVVRTVEARESSAVDGPASRNESLRAGPDERLDAAPDSRSAVSAAELRRAIPRLRTWHRALLSLVAFALILIALSIWPAFRRAPSLEAAASIAVLPFIDLTAERSGQPFCDGLAEELSNWLSQIPNLKVVARSSAFALRDAQEDVRAIGKRLNTNHVLEGSLRRSGDHARITVQLIDTRNGYHVWSDEFDKPMEDTIAMQEDISRAVAETLQIRLTHETGERFAARRIDNPQAYEKYLRATYYQQLRTKAANDRALDLYSQVLAADPKFVLAYVGLSYARLNQQWFDNRPLQDVAAETEPLIQKALLIDDRLAEIYTVRAALRSDQFRLREALDDLHKAIALNPNDGRAFAEMGRLLLQDGKPRDAVPQFSHAIDLDPLDFRLFYGRCTAFEDTAQFSEASTACRQSLELQPDNADALEALARLAWAQGLIDEALRWNKQSLSKAPQNFQLYRNRAELYLALGMTRQAHAVLESGRATSSDDDLTDATIASVALREEEPAFEASVRGERLEKTQNVAVLLELAHSSILARKALAAQRFATRAMAGSDRDPLLIDTAWAARDGDSCRLDLAAAETILGQSASAGRRLQSLLVMLDEMITAGVERNAVYVLRSEAQAMRGNQVEAMRDLQHAVDLGWRDVWIAQHAPYFDSLRRRDDFIALLTRVSRSNERLRDQITSGKDVTL